MGISVRLGTVLVGLAISMSSQLVLSEEPEVRPNVLMILVECGFQCVDVIPWQDDRVGTLFCGLARRRRSTSAHRWLVVDHDIVVPAMVVALKANDLVSSGM